MALYLQLIKFTPAGAKGVLETGFENRVSNVVAPAAASFGGTLKGSWPVADGDWHWVNLLEAPDDWSTGAVARGGFQLAASGVVEETRMMRLAEAADVDAAQAIDYRPPGS